MVIVSVTRGALRDEFDMADEAFALSPISARASFPSEEDYDAISQAFMETSRGRWFLGEYAKRNRNADTRMVLDAVARIEETLAVDKEVAARSRLGETLAAIRHAVDEAQAAAATAGGNLAPEENLSPIRKGTRIIREISWRWREIGADSRICDLIDSQADAIETACGQISSTRPQAALSAALDLIRARIALLEDREPPADEAADRSSRPAPSNEIRTRATGSAEQTSAAKAAEVVISMPADALVDAPDFRATTVDNKSDGADAPANVAQTRVDSIGHYDDALLDLVALEMAAPDGGDDAPVMADDEIDLAETAPTAPVVVAEKPAPMATPVEPPPVQASNEAPPTSSLGSTLIANGIVKKPKPTLSDPLAPIRRMSQAEKIAFFS
jgi:hypothetical protein